MSSSIQPETIYQTILKTRGYTILEKLGEGSYAKVYLAEFSQESTDPSSGPTLKLAVKIIDTKYGPNDFIKSFLPRELNILSQISHPHIIHIHSILQIGLKFYIFMRFAEQGDLLEYMIKNGLINENQARVWTRQIALAIQYLHELNIAHRDLKCENILVTMNYNAKLADFGFARYSVDYKRRPVLSETYCGSLAYASPEVLKGRPYDPKLSDLWALGVVIYVMLNKSVPFEETNPKFLYENQLNRNYKFRSKVDSTLSNEVKTLVQNLLDPDPMRRYRIEGVVNSDWVRMDERLIPLRPCELEALSNAFENELTPPKKFELPKFKAVAKTSSLLNDKSEKRDYVSMLKPYKHETRLSENSKIPPKQDETEINDEIDELNTS